MKRTVIGCTIIVTAALLGTLANAQAAPRRPVHAARVSACVAEQRAAISQTLGQYGNHVPTAAPAVMQQIMNPVLDDLWNRCWPRYNGPSW
jgi:hypothetical protein